MKVIYALAGRKTNAKAIKDAAKLDYIKKSDLTIDLTYGKGNFWTKWQPDNLRRADLNPEKSPDVPGGLDATNTGMADGLFDVVVIDPPYKLNGTSNKGGPARSDESFGVDGKYVSVAARLALMEAMFNEGVRILKPKGILIYKCQAQVNANRIVWQDHLVAEWGKAQGVRLKDILFVEGSRAQSAKRKQRHARRNYSSMLIMEKGARPRARKAS